MGVGALRHLAYTVHVCVAEHKVLSIKQGVEFYYFNSVEFYYFNSKILIIILIENSLKSVVNIVFLG